MGEQMRQSEAGCGLVFIPGCGISWRSCGLGEPGLLTPEVLRPLLTSPSLAHVTVGMGSLHPPELSVVSYGAPGTEFLLTPGPAAMGLATQNTGIESEVEITELLTWNNRSAQQSF